MHWMRLLDCHNFAESRFFLQNLLFSFSNELIQSNGVYFHRHDRAKHTDTACHTTGQLMKRDEREHIELERLSVEIRKFMAETRKLKTEEKKCGVSQCSTHLRLVQDWSLHS